jgi:hypothetical protein
MTVLVAVVGCESRKDQMEAQRSTWVKDSLVDVKFFLAKQDRRPLPDEVFLDVGDGYEDLPAKVRGVHRWVWHHGYEYLLKLDDDVVLFSHRLREPRGDYLGWKQESVTDSYCAGVACWFSRRSMGVLADAELFGTAEDLWAGRTLNQAGIFAEDVPGMVQWFGKVGFRQRQPRDWHALVAAEFEAMEMAEVYAA